VSWDEDTLLGQLIYDNKNSGKTIRGREMLNKICGDRIPQMFWNWKGLE